MAKILCIEDETDLRENIVEELNDAGYETIEAQNGKAGLEAIMAHSPDLVLCDIRMPVMDGNQLLKHVRDKLPELADTPFVFLTALNSRDSVISGKILGADDYLTKPIDFDLLLATVKARLEQIERIRAKKETEFVRLYKHFSKVGPEGAQPEADASTAQAPRTSQDGAHRAPSPQSNREFKDKVADAAALNENKVTAARMQMIGLRDVKKNLGHRWEELAKYVLSVAEATIGAYLQPEDTFSATDDEAFIICFASQSPEEGRTRAKAIEDHIAERIFNSGQIEACAGALAPGMETDTLAHINTEVHEVAVAPPELASATGPVALIVSKLDGIAAEIRSNAMALLEEATKHSKFHPRKLQTRRGAPANLQIADFDAFTRTKIVKVKELCHGDAEAIAKLDMLIVGSAAEFLYRESHGNPASVVADISFTTIRDRWHAGQLTDLCEKVPGILIQHLLFKIRGLPTTAAGSTLSEALAVLQKHSKAQMLHLGEPSLGAIDLAKHRLPVVAMDFADFNRSARRYKSSVQAFFDKVHDCNARILIDNVSRFDKRGLLNEWNVDLIGMEPED